MQGHHRHKNPDGSEGGWVSDESRVADSVFIAPTAIVRRGAYLSGNVRILDQSSVGDVIIKDNAVIRDNSYVNNCLIKDNAELSGRAFVDGATHGRLESDYNLTVGGDTRIRHYSLPFRAEAFKLVLSGGNYELPSNYSTLELIPPALGFDGAYNPETGQVKVTTIGTTDVQTGKIIPLDHQEEVLQYFDYKALPGLDPTHWASDRKGYMASVEKERILAKDRQRK